MYTHCPSCDTCFEITQESLDIAQGKVRCGQCDHVFNGLNTGNAEEAITDNAKDKGKENPCGQGKDTEETKVKWNEAL